MLGGVIGHGELFSLLVVKLAGHALQQDAGKADDGVKRCSQLMAHGGKKLRF